MVVTREQLQFLFSDEILLKGACMSLSFTVEQDEKFSECWLGKMPDPKKLQKDVYWLSLTTDGSKAYYYDSLIEMITAKVFHEKSLLDIAGRIDWKSIDGEDFDTTVRYYLQFE